MSTLGAALSPIALQIPARPSRLGALYLRWRCWGLLLTCEAVGFHESNSGSLALAERWNGAKWAAQTTSNPGRAGPSLSDVSCVSTGACEAVGLDSSRGGTLAVMWNGAKWTIQATPAP